MNGGWVRLIKASFMKLSIIVVNWNTCDLTRQALASIFDQTHGFEYEVIVIDNDSKDASVRMIKDEFPQVVLIENTENVGFGKANNQGMRVAQGEYIFLLNSDTIVLDHAVNVLVAYLDEHLEAMCVGPKLLNSDMTFQHACRRNLPNPMNSFFHLFGFAKVFKRSKRATAYKRFTDNTDVTENVEAISGAAMMFRREVFEKTSGFDERFFFYGEDLDLCKQIQDHGWKIVYVSEAQIIHFGGGSSKKRKRSALVNFYDSMWIYYQKHFKYNLLFDFCVFVGIKIKMLIALGINFFKK